MINSVRDERRAKQRKVQITFHSIFRLVEKYTMIRLVLAFCVLSVLFVTLVMLVLPNHFTLSRMSPSCCTVAIKLPACQNCP